MLAVAEAQGVMVNSELNSRFEFISCPLTNAEVMDVKGVEELLDSWVNDRDRTGTRAPSAHQNMEIHNVNESSVRQKWLKDSSGIGGGARKRNRRAE